MAYTRADLDAIDKAILDLTLGKRVASVTVAGRTVAYQPADLAALERARDRIKAKLDEQSGKRRSRSRVVVSRKGL